MRVVLVVVELKQGLQEGMLSEWSRWWRPKEQDTTSGGSSGRIWMKIRQGSKMAVEESIVALSWERSCFVVLPLAAGVKSETA